MFLRKLLYIESTIPVSENSFSLSNRSIPPIQFPALRKKCVDDCSTRQMENYFAFVSFSHVLKSFLQQEQATVKAIFWTQIFSLV